MREVIGQSVDKPVLRQTDAKVTARNLRIVQRLHDFIQTLRRHFNIDMNKPEDVAVRSARARIHLNGSTANGRDQLIAKVDG